jgi:BlaR1 peptidase M56/TonB-dependent Receptor Plug Domain
MNKTEVFMYLLKSMILSGIFFGYYTLFLKNTIYHAYNRFYLLASMALSLVIPCFHLSMFTISEEALPAAQVLTYLSTVAQGPVAQPSIAWEIVAMGVISGLFVAYLAYSILRIYLLKLKNPVTQMGDFDFIETELEEAPFSFFNNLFWKKSISIEDESGRKILQHELSHIRQNHSLDRLFSQMICAIFWMNPLNWIMQKELQNIHEFIADRDAVGAGEVDAFAKMLLQTYYGNHFLNPSHSFYYSSIKRRIIMLTTSKTPKYAYLRRVAVLPMLAFILALFSIQLSAQKPKRKQAKEPQFLVTMHPDSTTFSDPKTGKKVFSVATRDMPPPPPPAVAPVFPVPPTPHLSGSVSDVKMIYVDSTTVEFKDKKGGNTIVFRAEKVSNSTESPKGQAGVVLKPAASNKEKPLIVIDGVVTRNIDLNSINPDNIQSVNVLKGDKAISKYPESGANGVIEITTKKP